MHGFWILVLSNALVATGLALLVAVIARVWRNPVVLHVLWVLVLVKLFLPPILGIPVVGLAGRADDSRPMASSGPTSFEPANAVPAMGIVDEAPGFDAPVEMRATARSARPPGEMSWGMILAAVWVVGVALSLALAVWRLITFSTLMRRHAIDAPPVVRTTARRLCEQLGLRRCPQILMLRAKIPPMVWLAAGRAKIVLPAGLLENLQRPALEAVLLHELAHIRRRDGLVRWLDLIATVVFWWHPVAWWARRELRELEEQCCDAMVVRAMPRLARDYAAALVDTLDFLSKPSRVALPAGTTPWRTTSLARRIAMLKNPNAGRVTLGGLALLVAMIALPMAIAFGAGPAKATKPQPPSNDKAELMGRVMWVMMHGGRDVTAMKSIEWGEPRTDEKGNRSIRHKYYATIWDREVVIMNQIFTFDPKGNPINMQHVEGFPKKKVERKFDVSTKNGMIELVRHFFTRNFRDITSRNTIEWGEPIKHENGNVSIRYKYEATIWGKDHKIMNQVFTFGPDGKFVDYKNVDGYPKDKTNETTRAASSKNRLVITLDNDGNVSLDGEKPTVDQLVKKLEAFAETAPKDGWALIRVRARCPEKKVDEIRELCRKAGVKGVAISFPDDDPAKTGPPASAAKGRSTD